MRQAAIATAATAPHRPHVDRDVQRFIRSLVLDRFIGKAAMGEAMRSARSREAPEE
jgi:hypothetical protein